MDRLDQGLSKYFAGWLRYGVKEKDGTTTTIYPDERIAVRSTLDADGEIFFGPAKDIRNQYVLHSDLNENDLANHKINGTWRPGRLVVETATNHYQVWVRYDKSLGADRLRKNADNWARLKAGSQIVHCDHEMHEKVHRRDKMSPILEKLSRYFGVYEFGVYKEAEGDKDGAVWTVKPTDNTIGYLKAMNAQGKHIFIRPSFDKEPHFMMHDDLDAEGLFRHHKDDNGNWLPGRLVVESSLGNFQVWVNSDRPLNVEEKQHWLKEMQSDPGASPLHRWGRAPGFRNRKAKYKTDKGYPLARLKWIDWQNQAELPHVEIEKEPRHTPVFGPSSRPQLCDGELPDRSQYYKGVDAKGKVKESEQDFAYMLALLRRGVDDEMIKNRVMNERTNWENHKGSKRMADYLGRSLEKAKAIIENSSYRIEIYRGRNRKKLKSVSVDNVPAGRDHKAYLDQRLRDTVVKEGFELVGIVVEIRKCSQHQGLRENRALGFPSLVEKKEDGYYEVDLSRGIRFHGLNRG